MHKLTVALLLCLPLALAACGDDKKATPEASDPGTSPGSGGGGGAQAAAFDGGGWDGGDGFKGAEGSVRVVAYFNPH